MKKLFVSVFFVFVAGFLSAQNNLIDYSSVKEYTLVGVYVHGCQLVDSNVVRLISGLPIGDKINVPGEKTSAAIDNLWKEGMFEDLRIEVAKVEGEYIWLNIIVTEMPKITVHRFVGVKKNEKEDLDKKIGSLGGMMLTEYRKRFIVETVNEHFRLDGYMNCKTDLVIMPDTLKGAVAKGNYVKFDIVVNKGKKVRIQDVIITGNKDFKISKVRRLLKDTKQQHWYLFFKSSKYLEDNLQKDETKLIAKYNQKGYRDAKIVKDTVWKSASDPNRVCIKIDISEGHIYKFGKITWVGNTKYSSEQLNDRLGIKSGDVYNQEQLESRLYQSQQGNDVSALYMDDGYLFFQINPIEVNVHGDSIDYEMRIYEGRQATIRNVTIVGNTKTNDKVVMREIRTRPGQLFRRSDVIRSQRELATLGYFDPEKIQINPKPNPSDGTVDIEYVVVEKPSDQVELSGGWGANRIVGTLGVSFNNFSTHNFWDKSEWRPLPSGDGQKLSIRAQSNGLYFQSYNASFTEPWLGGKKPNSLSLTLYRSVQSNGLMRNDAGRQDVKITGASVGFGMRLKRPDDFFQLYMELNYQYYQLNHFASVFAFSDGYSNNASARFTLNRNSTDQQIYPRSGSDIKLIGQFTIPYSLFNNKDYSTLSTQERYKFVEYYKWKFTSSWFTRLAGNLVLNTRVGFGYLGMYNKAVGLSPFERFYLGGSGLTGYALDGREIIADRGYDDQALTASRTGSPIIAKYTWELRYPVSLNPSATVYGLAFAEAGNTWNTIKAFNPFDVYRSAGVGVRVFLPMFGLLGLDWGYRFDNVPSAPFMQKSQVHFTIGMNLGEL
ncbi:MAG: outer membrane protein assembly factor BamA [Bacteroidetes bacterium]|nr:outer membrane protein assembly factor BamA [Bacteroidota bacterium]